MCPNVSGQNLHAIIRVYVERRVREWGEGDRWRSGVCGNGVKQECKGE